MEKPRDIGDLSPESKRELMQLFTLPAWGLFIEILEARQARIETEIKEQERELGYNPHLATDISANRKCIDFIEEDIFGLKTALQSITVEEPDNDPDPFDTDEDIQQEVENS
jgi:hypothetical protein